MPWTYQAKLPRAGIRPGSARRELVRTSKVRQALAEALRANPDLFHDYGGKAITQAMAAVTGEPVTRSQVYYARSLIYQTARAESGQYATCAAPGCTRSLVGLRKAGRYCSRACSNRGLRRDIRSHATVQAWRTKKRHTPKARLLRPVAGNPEQRWGARPALSDEERQAWQAS